MNLIDTRLDLSVFDKRYKNDKTGAMAIKSGTLGAILPERY
jgi:hypothetical protein